MDLFVWQSDIALIYGNTKKSLKPISTKVWKKKQSFSIHIPIDFLT